jgi:16S rRNA (uracil1498-N3)-methyltransferase
MDRIEWFIEKSIEMGVSEISFIQCLHGERKMVKMERLKRIIIAACKQSKKAIFPIVNDIVKFPVWLDHIKNKRADHLFIATLFDDTKFLVSRYKSNDSVVICIGPEGGFREEEVSLAIAKNFDSVSLGSQRLRTETAGIFSVAMIHTINMM